jgi:hypothetical protein
MERQRDPVQLPLVVPWALTLITLACIILVLADINRSVRRIADAAEAFEGYSITFCEHEPTAPRKTSLLPEDAEGVR